MKKWIQNWINATKETKLFFLTALLYLLPVVGGALYSYFILFRK